MRRNLAGVNIRAFIFDFNGVIVDDEHLHFELFRDLLAEHDIDLDEPAYHERFLGYDDKGCFSAALAEADRSFDAALIDSLISEKARRYALAAQTRLRFFPGASERIEECSAAGRVAICSGALRSEIDAALEALEVPHKIEVIVAAEDVKQCKPDPEGYRLAAERLRATERELTAESCLAIEDSLAGVASARSAGMVVVGVAHTYAIDELIEAGADFTLESLRPPLLPELSARGMVIGRCDRKGGGDASHRPGLLISRDLFFVSKVTGTARELGAEIVTAHDAAAAVRSIAETTPAVIFLDLAAADAATATAVEAYRRAAGGPITIIAFGSHVNADELERVRSLGCTALPRSRFSTQLADLIEAHLIPRSV